MGLPKGRTNNPAGKPKGTPNRFTRDLRERIYDLIDRKWDTLEEDLDCLEPKDRLAFLEKLMSYTIPKLQSVEYVPDAEKLLNGLSDEQLNQLLEHVNARIDESQR